MSQWYIRRGAESNGPYSSTDLRALAKKGLLQFDDLLWKDGLDQPIVASRFKELFDVPELRKKHSPGSQQIFDNSGDLNNSERANTGRSIGKDFLESGVNIDSESQKTKRDQLGGSLGTAVQETIGSGVLAFTELLSAPIKYTFGTLVFLIACILSIGGLITGLLIPVFVLGYISYMQSVLRREQVSLANFIVFMRHGWDSLWHLLMLVGAFFVAAAMAIAPFVIAGLVAYGILGTLGIAGLKLLGLLKIIDFQIREVPPQLIGFFCLFVILPTLQILSSAIMILIYCLALMVSTDKFISDNKYDLVYNAFVRMLRIASQRWKRLLASGFWLFAIQLVSVSLLGIILAVAIFYFPFLAMWMTGVFAPLAAIVFLLYLNIFTVHTAMQLVESIELRSLQSDGQLNPPPVMGKKTNSL